jgi:hypothetical protein
MAEPHPPPFYTSSLTSPLDKFDLTSSAVWAIVRLSIRRGLAPRLNPATGLGDATVPWAEKTPDARNVSSEGESPRRSTA